MPESPAPSDLGRLSEITAAVVRHGFGHVIHSSRRARQARRSGLPPPDQAALQRGLADRFASLLEDLGPTFVKLGQILSTRSDLMPPAFIESLSRLQDQVPPLPFEVIKAAVETSLGKPLPEVFKEFDPVALASASIAQVHGATLRDGQSVVVKVQRPNIRARMQADISLLTTMANIFDAVFEEAGVYRSQVVVQEFDLALRAELDFTQELANIQAFHKAQALRPEAERVVRIPSVHPELCSKTVLVMERMRGTRLSDLPPGYDKVSLSHRFVTLSFQMVFEDGLFHGDPHPGNVLIQEDGRIGLLDFGLVGRLSREGQNRLVMLLMAVGLQDPDSVARVLYRLGDSDDRVPLTAFRGAIANLIDRYIGLSLHEIESKALMRDLLEVAVQHQVRVPREYAILGKAAITFEGVIRSLNPELDAGAVAIPYATRMMRERFDFTKLESGAPRVMLQLMGLAQDLPLQVSQILLDLEAGKLTVRVAGPGITELSRAVRLLALSVIGGGIGTAIVSAAMADLSKLDVRVWNVPLIPVMGLAVGVFLIAAVIGYVVHDGKFPKASLRKLLRWLSGG